MLSSPSSIGLELWYQILNQFPYLTNKYFVSLLILAATIILAKIALVIFEKYLRKAVQKTKTQVDDLIFERTEKPIFYFILVYGFLAVIDIYLLVKFARKGPDDDLSSIVKISNN